MGTLFTVSAYMFLGAILWAPAGLVASVVLASTFTTGRFRNWHPVVYVGCCIAAVVLVFVDPGQIFTDYFD
ncbi:MAG: hypothetical protein AAF497_16510 [Planctomycetota bacterium]